MARRCALLGKIASVPAWAMPARTVAPITRGSMFFRLLVPLALALVAQAGLCRDVSADVDLAAVYRELMEESKRDCGEKEDSLYREDSAYARKAWRYASSILSSDKRRWLWQHRDVKLRDEDYFYSHLGLRTYGLAHIPTRVFDSVVPRAYICAHGALYISSAFLDPDSPVHLTDQELAALVAHEYVHFRDGHVLMQRATAKLRDGGETTGRSPGPLETSTGIADVRALFADEGREFEADGGALQILEAIQVPSDAYASMMAKLVKAAPADSAGLVLLVKRQTCLSRVQQAPQRFFWITLAARAKIEAEGLVLMDQRRGGSRFFLRHANIFGKVNAENSLPIGPPPPGAELIALTRHDLYAVCAMAQQITKVPKEAKPLAEALNKAVLDWLGGAGKETLNEIL